MTKYYYIEKLLYQYLLPHIENKQKIIYMEKLFLSEQEPRIYNYFDFNFITFCVGDKKLFQN